MFDDDDPDDLFSNRKGPGTLYTSPRKTVDYIQLRFQLARFQVYRIVRLPTTFTFANLHTLIQYMFGWNDSHLHKAEVFTNVVLHDEEVLLGTIKSCGCKRPPEDWELRDPGALDDWMRFGQEIYPVYRVEPTVKNRKDKFDHVMLMEEKGITFESIWSSTEPSNVSDGRCPNEEIGIIYTYDFGDEWTVHITCEQGNVFQRLDSLNNLPIFKDARGAVNPMYSCNVAITDDKIQPPVEHVESEYFLEDDAEDKKVPPRFFDVSYFQGYCDGKVTSETRKTKLDILTLEEAKNKYHEYLEREKEREERIASGELREDDDEYYDGVYYDGEDD